MRHEILGFYKYQSVFKLLIVSVFLAKINKFSGHKLNFMLDLVEIRKICYNIG